MAASNRPGPEEHRAQIEAYRQQLPAYRTYADVMRRLLCNACAVSFPEAMIQARPKSISSFAEKVVRKYAKYPDAVNQMTDLCGARVVVQTAAQVRAVRQFIENNFSILECDDKGILLGEDKFGYRDLHYIVRCRPDRAVAMGVTEAEAAAIGNRPCEIQVRTWVQHAWADTLHDRIYKNKLRLSPEIGRTGALLAAMMEEGDRTFDRLVDELDGLIANYAAYAPRAEVEEEVRTQEIILLNEPSEDKKPALSLGLARLLAASGQHARVAELLEPYATLRGAMRAEILLYLGGALCASNRQRPASAEYARGIALLREALALCEEKETTFAPNRRQRESLLAKILTRLAWALEVLPAEAKAARACYHAAHEHEPENPYYLANMLGFEIYCTRSQHLPDTMRPTIREAICTCAAHAAAGIELPYACLAAARLNLMLGQVSALEHYARAIQHILSRQYCAPLELLDTETEWLQRLYVGVEIPALCQDAIRLLKLARQTSLREAGQEAGSLKAPVLIIAGGAATLPNELREPVRDMLQNALAVCAGTVVAGGTAVGVPGCVGDAAAALALAGNKRFKLVGYRPSRLPDDAPPHPAYDHALRIGDTFGAIQILQNWSDILDSGIHPSDVTLVGFGGGALAALEYRLALAFGAGVGLISGTGGAVDALLQDPLWHSAPNLYPMPLDPATLQAFLSPRPEVNRDAHEQMARQFHQRYVSTSTGKLPPNMRPWDDLPETYRQANREQARCALQILSAAGFGVRPAEGEPRMPSFSADEIELMARMEHGRWNVERLRNGWRYGPRDDARKTHNCLVSWDQLPRQPEDVRRYDREAVCAIPGILAEAGLEVYRKEPSRAA